VIKLAAAGGMIAAVLALLVTLYVGARTRGLEAHCRNNLRQLGDIAWRNRNSIDPDRKGRDFWQAVREAQYRDVRGKWQRLDPDPFICPVHGTTVSKVDDLKAIDYRGPAKVREQMKDTPKAEPLGADRAGNHSSGGFVLRLDTSVEEAPRLVERAKEGDPLWAAAEAALKD
jgi:hypothetical protein